jgi:hypothetical protein
LKRIFDVSSGADSTQTVLGWLSLRMEDNLQEYPVRSVCPSTF